jgi:hypothetical protein
VAFCKGGNIMTLPEVLLWLICKQMGTARMVSRHLVQTTCLNFLE